MSFLRRRSNRRVLRGQALVETALILPIIVMVLLLGVDLGRVFMDSIELRNAAHEATMLGGTKPDAPCGQVKAVVDLEMARNAPDDAVCGPLTGNTGRVFITLSECEGGCQPWTPPYPAASDLRFHVKLAYRFQPIMPLVGFLTGNGMGGSIPLSVENRSPILVGYEGG